MNTETATCSHPKIKKFGKYGRMKIQRYRCLDCGATISDPKPQSPLGKMRVDIDDAVKALQCLLEGCSIRSTERLTGMNRNTIMSLLVLAGERCADLMDATMRNLKFKFIQADEIWCFVGKKQKRVRKDDPAEFGDNWIFIAIDSDTKLVPCYVVGKRDKQTTVRFLEALKGTTTEDRFQLTTDGFHFYERGVENVFAGQTDFAQLVKLYGDYGQFGNERYSPGKIMEVISKIRDGRPDPEHISTSHVERQNLTVRMMMRRLTRLTNAFSKKGLNLRAAAALHFAYYNFCRVHQTLRVTPAMEHGITDHIWTIRELLESK
ncbi:MAG TPA: DDE-type integrase/transposase/recombinase [Candidatus Angelobacter sp.]|nr:DDE-type integrase/transposase/recombinase [Candidatus Angelobacter sp.]